MLADDIDDFLGEMRLASGWSRAQWDAHDAKIEALHAREAREAAEATMERNRTIMLAHDAPHDCIRPQGGVRDTAAIVQLALAMATPGKRMVVVAGGVGCGKTTGAVQWLLHCKGRPLFVPAPSLIQRARAKPWLAPIWEQATAIVIDDVGTEKERDRDRFLEAFGELLTHVHAQKKRMVLTANMQMQEFRDRYKKRIESRFRQGGVWISLTGGDMRLEKR